MENIISIKNLCISFNENNEVVRDININILEGKTTAIVGESGSGKTLSALSILKLLPSSAKITKGEILFNVNISEWGIYGDSIDISNDGIDNDGDGFIDSEDSDEVGAPRDAAKLIAINKIADRISTKIISTW